MAKDNYYLIERLHAISALVADSTGQLGICAFGYTGRDQVHLTTEFFIELFGKCDYIETHPDEHDPEHTEYHYHYKGTDFFCLPNFMERKHERTTTI